MERTEDAGVVGRAAGQMDRGRRAGLHRRPAPFLPATARSNRSRGDLGRRLIHHAARWPSMAVRARVPKAQAARRALPAPGIGLSTRRLTAAAQTGPAYR